MAFAREILHSLDFVFQIKLNFLMVGHTHEDVDQMFSRISSKLAKVDVHTLPQLMTAIEESTTPSPEVIHLRSIVDYRASLLQVKGLIGSIRDTHVFKFQQNADGLMKVFYKGWPVEDEPYGVLDVTPFVPDMRRLSNAGINEKIITALHRMEEDLPKWAANGRLENSSVDWWKCYLGSCRRETRLRPDLLGLASLGTYRFPAREPVVDEEAGNLIAAIRRNHEKERKKVVLTLKKKPPT